MLTKYPEFVNTVLFKYFDGIVQLPHPQTTLSCKITDAPLYRDGSTSMHTHGVLTQPHFECFEDMLQLRDGDTRTIVIRVAAKDVIREQTNVPLHASMSGCVMTIYPVAFNQVRMADVDPIAYGYNTINALTTTLSSTIIHELAHHMYAHNGKACVLSLHTFSMKLHTLAIETNLRTATDVKLLRDNFPSLWWHPIAVNPGEDYCVCYGHDACGALAQSSQANEAITNAESVMLVIDTIAVSKAYPDLDVMNTSGRISYRFPVNINPQLLTTEWDCFRHHGSVANIPGYTTANDRTPAPHSGRDWEAFKRTSFVLRPGDPRDECYEGVEYAYGDAPWVVPESPYPNGDWWETL